MPTINLYEGHKNELLAECRKQLKPLIDETLAAGDEIVNSRDASPAHRATAEAIVSALTKPYGQPLRGIMLCMPDAEMPDALRGRVSALLDAFLLALVQLKPQHERLLAELATRLQSTRENRLQEGRLTEQLAIDMYVDKLSPLVQPLRVLANRSPRTGYYEDARLLEVRRVDGQYEYHLAFTLDGHRQWVQPQRIRTSAIEPALSLPYVDEGPGKAVTDDTDLLNGQVLANSPMGWKPVMVIDESAAGVVLHWQGPAEPVEFYLPRQRLRIVPKD